METRIIFRDPESHLKIDIILKKDNKKYSYQRYKIFNSCIKKYLSKDYDIGA